MDIEILRLRFKQASRTGEVALYSEAWYSMVNLINSLRPQTVQDGDSWAKYGGLSNFDLQTLDALLRLLDPPQRRPPPRRPV